MSSYLYRPTPVVNLGNGWFASNAVTLGASKSGRMTSARPGAFYSRYFDRLRRADTRRIPWLSGSGTMGSFVPVGLGGLGDDSVDVGDIVAGAGDIAPNLPSPFTPPDLTPPDLGSPSFQPNLPALIPPSSSPVAPSPVPPAAAGPTGTGIPGTQPVNQNLAIAQSGLSFFEKLFGKNPSAPPAPVTPYRALPGYGGTPVASGASWFSQSTIFPQMSNGMVVGIAVAAVLLLGGSGYAVGRSR